MFLNDAAKKEMEFPSLITLKSTGIGVKRLQEWLTFHNCATPIDGDFGAATAAALGRFEVQSGLPSNGALTLNTWNKLVEPMAQALAAAPVGLSLASAVVAVAHAHLRVHPVELGGDNAGPWVRLYMGGKDGVDELWCAGFVSFVLAQACNITGAAMPIKGSKSCDKLAAQAKLANLFLPIKGGSTVNNLWSSPDAVYIFLKRLKKDDWNHTGFAISGDEKTFLTIEGNARHDRKYGNRSYEVCSMSRSLDGYDFIKLN